MTTPRIFCQISKVDEAKRLVLARAAQEIVDKVDEIMDYSKSRPYFEAWSKEQFDASGGKSYGNVRAMHGKIAAGILPEPIVFNDAEKAFDVSIKVTDDQEWSKCLDGTYTGVSLGGSYVGDRVTEKIDGKDVRRYTAKPVEISLVDSPCIPTARFFDIIKADGALEKRAFKDAPAIDGTQAEVDEFTRVLAANGMSLGDAIRLVNETADEKAVKAMLVTVEEIEKIEVSKREFSADERKAAAKEGAALPDGSFPIKSVGDLKNAVRAYGRAKDKAAAKAHIIKRAKALGATKELPEDWTKSEKAARKPVAGAVYKATTPELRKGMWNVSDFASCLSCVASICRGAQDDFDVEGDNSPVPAQLRNWLGDGIELFKEMADEEAGELLAQLKSGAGIGPDDEIEMAFEAFARYDALAKRLKDPALSFEDFAKLAASHLTADEIKPLGRDTEKIAAAVLAKAKMPAAHMDKMQAIHDHAASMGATCSAEKKADGDALAKATAPLAAQVAELQAEVKKLKDQPAPHPLTVLLATRTVSKTTLADAGGAEITIDKIPEADRIKNADGSIDHAATLLIAKTKALAATAAGSR